MSLALPKSPGRVSRPKCWTVLRRGSCSSAARERAFMRWPLQHPPKVASVRRLVLELLENRALLASLPPNFIETPVAEGLSNATAMEFAPNGDLWVLEQTGLVKRFHPSSTAADVVSNLSTLGLSSSGERGVLGVAFDPQYATNKQIFVYYTATTPTIHNRISRFTVNDTDAADYFFAGANVGGTDA